MLRVDLPDELYKVLKDQYDAGVSLSKSVPVRRFIESTPIYQSLCEDGFVHIKNNGWLFFSEASSKDGLNKINSTKRNHETGGLQAPCATLKETGDMAMYMACLVDLRKGEGAIYISRGRRM